MRFHSRLKASHTLIDLTPLIDVIFLLLIFFLITSDILPLKSLAIENPTLANYDSQANLTQLLVVMDQDQVIYIGSKKDIVDMSSLKEHLMRQISVMRVKSPDFTPTIALHIDRRVDYGAFLRLFAIVQECSCHIRLSYKSSNS